MKILQVLVLFFALAGSARACDVCAVFSATAAEGAQRGPFAGVAAQFTHFGTLQNNGHEVADEFGQHLDSSITQFLAGYGFSGRFSLQCNVPWIYREFRRPEGFRVDRGAESGLGDISVLGNFIALRWDTEPVTFTWKILGGVKFPTGDTSRLKEELSEEEIEGAPESGIHGHDLTLGSGSIDGILGTEIHLRYKRIFFSGAVQYAIRSRGDYAYRYANDLSWNFGPGAYVFLNHQFTVALSSNLSGEHKGLDRFRGESADDTGITAWYVGPMIAATFQERISAQIGADLPVTIHNTALQAVPDFRLRVALAVRF